jgi:hypothetical protein
MKQVLGTPKSHPKEVEAPPLITRIHLFSRFKIRIFDGLFPLIKMQDNIHPQSAPYTLSQKSNCAQMLLLQTLLSGVEVPFLIPYHSLPRFKFRKTFIGFSLVQSDNISTTSLSYTNVSFWDE